MPVTTLQARACIAEFTMQADDLHNVLQEPFFFPKLITSFPVAHYSIDERLMRV
jgi:hypothetical protein